MRALPPTLPKGVFFRDIRGFVFLGVGPERPSNPGQCPLGAQESGCAAIFFAQTRIITVIGSKGGWSGACVVGFGRGVAVVLRAWVLAAECGVLLKGVRCARGRRGVCVVSGCEGAGGYFL